jgi:NAD-dependent dihydropyrimidine dehydrogenase PreA subunit
MADDKAVVDEEECIDCGVCVDACPEEAISME